MRAPHLSVYVAERRQQASRTGCRYDVLGAYPGGFVGYLGEPTQVAAGGRPLAVAAEVGREGGEGGAVREAARAVFESEGEGAGGGSNLVGILGCVHLPHVLAPAPGPVDHAH